MIKYLGQSSIVERRIASRLDDNINYVLDAACGAGVYDCLFGNRFVVGIDINILKVLKARVLNPSVRYIIADINHLPFKNKVFGFVMAREIIEHLETPIVALNELNRVMNTDASMYLSTPSIEIKDTIYMKWYGVEKYNKREGHTRSGFTKTEILRLLRSSKFTIPMVKEDFKCINRILFNLVNFWGILRLPLSPFWIVGEKIDNMFNCKGIDYWMFTYKKT